MDKIQHKKQSKGDWQSKPFLEQMANIGSEVYRAINWKEKGNEEYSQLAFERSLELFDLTKESKLTYPQYKELLRMREIWVDYFKYDNDYNSTGEGINKYFMYTTIAFKNLHIA
jgi:hypothetical protein